MRSSIIKDPKLAPEGRQKIRWVEQHVPVLNAIHRKYLSDGTLSGLSVAVCVPHGVGIDRLTAHQEEHRRRWQ